MSDLYLASPYSHFNPEVREYRYKEACRAAAWLHDKGLDVFCPIAHGHGISLHGGLPWDAGYWSRHGHKRIDEAQAVIVLLLIGWISSTGLHGELAHARAHGKPIWWMQPSRGGGYQVFREFHGLGRQREAA